MKNIMHVLYKTFGHRPA